MTQECSLFWPLSMAPAYPFFPIICLCIYLFWAMLDLHCCSQAFSSCGEQWLLFLVVCGLLIAMACLVAKCRLQAQEFQYLQFIGSRAHSQELQCMGLVALRLCGIFPDQGSNPCSLHWQADSHPLYHQGSPTSPFYHKAGTARYLLRQSFMCQL